MSWSSFIMVPPSDVACPCGQRPTMPYKSNMRANRDHVAKC